MGKTSIEWTDETWNPTTGCTKVSTGCKHCYAERVWSRLSAPGQPYEGRAFSDVATHPDRLDAPLHWRKPRRVFVNSMSDVFHESVPFEFIAAVFGVMAATPQHTYQVLTKRPARMLDWFRWVLTRKQWECDDPQYQHPRWVLAAACTDIGSSARWTRHPPADWRWPLPNAWLGVSVENQDAANERLPLLLQTPAAVRFVSGEPLLGAVDLSPWMPPGKAIAQCSGCGLFTNDHRSLSTCKGYCQDPTGTSCNSWPCPRCGRHHYWCGSHIANGKPSGQPLDWVIVGGESGPKARPMHPDWARGIRDQCAAAGVPFFFKQWGEYVHPEQAPEDTWGGLDNQGDGYTDDLFRVGKRAAGRLLDGREHNEMPEVTP